VIDTMHLALSRPKLALNRSGGWMPQLFVMGGIATVVYVIVVYRRNKAAGHLFR
jgi:hypothetical protein